MNYYPRDSNLRFTARYQVSDPQLLGQNLWGLPFRFIGSLQVIVIYDPLFLFNVFK